MTHPAPSQRAPAARTRWLRQIFSFHAMLIGLMTVLIYLLAHGRVDDPDIWWHLRNAEYLFQNHQIPQVDMYTFTVAGAPWTSHQWLSEVWYYLSWRAGGILGVDLLSMGLIGLIFAGLVTLCYEHSRNLKASIIACSLVSYLTVVSFGPRTILFGYIHLLLLLILLERFRERNGSLWPIPFLFCSWINMHGLWLMGLVLFGVFTASGLVGGTWGRVISRRWTPSELRKLIGVGAASVAALFVNPFGWKLVFYPLNFTFEQKLVKTVIDEWKSVDFHQLQGMIALAIIGVILAGTLLRNHSWRLSDLGFLLLGLYCGLTYIRLLCLFAIVAAPVLARLLDFMPAYNAESDKPVMNVLIVVLVAGIALQTTPPLSADQLETIIAQKYPAGIQEYLREEPLKGPLLNMYLWGGYLTWHNRDVKIFIDGRADIFEYSGVMEEYGDVALLRKVDPILDKYGIRYVLFAPDQALAHALTQDPRWKENYRDDVSVLFERRD